MLCLGFDFVFNKSFVDYANKSIAEARTSLVIFAPTSIHRTGTDLQAASSFRNDYLPALGKKKHPVDQTLLASASSPTKVFLGLGVGIAFKPGEATREGWGPQDLLESLESEAPGKGAVPVSGSGGSPLPLLFALCSLHPTRLLSLVCPREIGPLKTGGQMTAQLHQSHSLGLCQAQKHLGSACMCLIQRMGKTFGVWRSPL